MEVLVLKSKLDVAGIKVGVLIEGSLISLIHLGTLRLLVEHRAANLGIGGLAVRARHGSML